MHPALAQRILREIRVADLPPELRAAEGGGAGPEAGEGTHPATGDWEHAVARWADARLEAGGTRLMDDAGPRFERVLIDAALRRSNGLRHEAARLLGWGRNTLTRKLARATDSSPPGD